MACTYSFNPNRETPAHEKNFVVHPYFAILRPPPQKKPQHFKNILYSLSYTMEIPKIFLQAEDCE